MFDKTIIQQGRTIYQDRLVPIDASHAAKLLQDVEEKAQERITKAISIDGNAFTALFQLEKEHHTDSLLWRLTFDLNGHRIVLDGSERNLDLRDDRKLCDKIIAEIAERIAHEIVAPAMLSALPRFR